MKCMRRRWTISIFPWHYLVDDEPEVLLSKGLLVRSKVSDEHRRLPPPQAS
jgi:hypothetical protein